MERTLVDFLQSRARRYGPRDALLFKPGFRFLRWSYSNLWSESGQVASLLQSRGLSKGDQVLLWGPNSPQWVLAFLGCVRAGVVVVPLDLRSAPDYVSRVVARTSLRLAFTSRYTPKGEADLGVPEVALEDLESAIFDLPEPEPVDIQPDDLVEIMFTSGTTGDPKGVTLTHRNLTANIEGVTQYVACDTSSRLLSILPLSHMYEQMGGLLAVLHFGASVTYPTSRQPAVLSRTMRERRITTLLLVPQGLELLMNGIEREVRRQGREALWGRLMKLAERTPFRLRRRLFGRVHRQFGGKLDFIVSGGAALDPALGRKWELMGVRVLQGYGATEASPVISNHTLEDRRPGSVGRPLPNVEVALSAEGEIMVRGESISPGYYNAPDQTAAAFVDGWYRTGDLGHFDDKGFLNIRGRLKDMIVLPSGQNVYPDDIQAVLNRHPGVTDSSVVGLPRAGSLEVHAALILAEGHDPEAIVSWANAQLAEQQHIRGFTVWPEEDFPRTHTLKVKKPALIETLISLAETGSTRTPLEASLARQAATTARRRDGTPSLAEIIAEVAPVDAAEVTQDMTLGNDLGLDSLGRVELLSAVESHLGVYLDENQVDSETTGRPAPAGAGRGRGQYCHEPVPWMGNALVVPDGPRLPAAHHVVSGCAGALSPECTGTGEAEGHRGPGVVCVQPPPWPGQPAHHQGHSADMATPVGHCRRREAVAKPRSLGAQPSSGQRLSAGAGWPDPPQSRKHGPYTGQRVVGANLPGGQADGRRANPAVQERYWPGCGRGTAAGGAHEAADQAIWQPVQVPHPEARVGGGALRGAAGVSA